MPSPSHEGPDRPVPIASLRDRQAYRVPRHPAPIDLYLDGNEGSSPPMDLLEGLSGNGTDLLRRYPDAGPLEALLAAHYGVEPDRVLVTAGGDDALERAIRCVVEPGRALVAPVPSFEMLGRFARMAGGEVREVPWPPGSPFPLQEFLAVVDRSVAAIAIVSPNNPTGAVALVDQFRALARQAPWALVLADLAYVEFADEDPTRDLLDLPNVVVFRTFSKAWGLAGLRVGHAIAPREVAGWMRAGGLPYPCSRPSLALAEARWRQGSQEVRAFVGQVRQERAALTARLADLGLHPFPGQGNFVLVRCPDAAWVRDALAGVGISVRAFPNHPDLRDDLRITCPGDPAAFDRLMAGLEQALDPQALLFDMDGVLADVRDSYLQAIGLTAASFGVPVTPEDVARAKALPGHNNDWVATRWLLSRAGVEVPLQEVIRRFEALYQGDGDRAGLHRLERLLVAPEVLRDLAARLPLAVVTGRPRRDARRFLEDQGIEDCFGALVCLEDAPGKPDPAPVRLAMDRLGVQRAWMIGDSPDDIRASRAAGVVPLGIGTEEDRALLAVGAARVLGSAAEVRDLLDRLPGGPGRGDGIGRPAARSTGGTS
ncbi:MAG TPA: aminotransferase class I/II-fold pyridoxal phosphate-dependent enzyme [Myxococcota bacterium]|nr:aminotransferase class I/II-fold pyridoxal phosphate-dependent enzyme [Myxococcota bacterium]HQK52501.1 aminotransferase class I/II-fold pyridoxal phosphate-dependent enzyme [Myxococcota bacterium]